MHAGVVRTYVRIADIAEAYEGSKLILVGAAEEEFGGSFLSVKKACE